MAVLEDQPVKQRSKILFPAARSGDTIGSDDLIGEN
jgi:hypothetical protein